MNAAPESRVAVVIEDDDDIRHLLETVLSQAGFRVVATSNGADGVEAVRENDPIVTTLDVNMPGMDGFETARRIRGFSTTYIVMLTALNEEIDTLQGLEAGADDYVNKPFRPRELRARIEAMLRRPRNTLPDGTVIPSGSDAITPTPPPPAAQNPTAVPPVPQNPYAAPQPGQSNPYGAPAAEPQQNPYAPPAYPAAAPVYPPAPGYPQQPPAYPAQPPTPAYAPQPGAQPAPYSPPPAPPTWEQTPSAPSVGAPPAAMPPQQVAMPSANPGGAGTPGRGTGWMEHNGLWLNFETRVVQLGNTELDLTRSEFDLLAALMESNRRVRTKADLVLLLRGESYVTSHFISEADKRAIEVHMGNLRKKIGDTTGTPRWIETVRGVGYRLTAPNE